MSVDLEGLVLDPQFKKLPPAQQDKLLRAAGASEAFITQITGAPQRPQEPEETPGYQFVQNAAEKALPGGEFLKRAGETAVNPLGGLVKVENGKLKFNLPNVASFWKDIGTGMYDMHREQFAKAKEEFGDKTGESAVHAVGGMVPFVGPPLAEAFEQGQSGDVAGGLGSAFGILAPLVAGEMAKVPARGLTKRMPARLRRGAQSNLTTVLRPEEGQVPFVLRNTEEIVEGLRGGGFGTPQAGYRRALLERVKGPQAAETLEASPESILGRASTQLEDVKAAGGDTPIDLDIAVENLRARRPYVEQGPVDVPGAPEAIDQPLRAAVEARAGELEKLAYSFGTPEIPPQVIGHRLNPVTNQIEPIMSPPVPAQTGPVPARTVFQIREQAGGMADAGNAMQETAYANPRAAAESFNMQRGEVADLLHGVPSRGMGPISLGRGQPVPGLAAADRNYSLWREVGDMLQHTVQQELRNPKAGAATIVAGRAPLRAAGAAGAALGAGGGAVAGGPVGAFLGGLGGAMAGVGGYGAYKIMQDILNSPYWNALSASQKLKLANAIQSGALTNLAEMSGPAGMGANAMSRYLEENPE